eukprot:TRINITY_DN38121_c0_g1_i1.p1 TRINITY_DN38121_c0_g1~~TRINITY_DN38121_c0_g1_i1.p1  ORF type:complete len:267 (+),score=44.20 TRINITY_DN38121_c0_g1_i1:59-859(+)
MVGVVVIKWGGGLITDKEKMCTADLQILKGLATVAANSSKQLVIVHGAGSFGHLKCKKYQIGTKSEHQKEGAAEVQEDMILLNNEVMRALKMAGVDAKVYHPHTWASGSGPNFEGELPFYSTGVTVVHGDVVPSKETDFTILSGDDLVVRYALEIPNVERLVFAVSGVDGLLTAPPTSDSSKLITTWSSDQPFVSSHDTNIDVTGGIYLKAKRGSLVADRDIDVLLVRGENLERVHAAIHGKDVIGTRIVRKPSKATIATENPFTR